VSTVSTPSLQELLEVPAYTIRYSSINDSVNMVVELQHRGQSTLTIDKTIGKTFLERAGEFYEIDLVADTAQKLSEPPAEYKRYLILTPQTLGKLQEKGQETFHGQLYQTQKYDNFTGYFGDGSLKLVSRRSDNTEFMIRSFDQTVGNGFDLLPGETGPEQSRGQEQSATSSAASSSLQLETVSIRPPADQKTGDVSVGQYIVFD